MLMKFNFFQSDFLTRMHEFMLNDCLSPIKNRPGRQGRLRKTKNLI